MWSLWRQLFTAAALSAAAAVAAVVWGWGVAQYPVLVPPALTVTAAAAPRAVLWALVWSVTGGAVLLVPALAYLFFLFKEKRPEPLGEEV